MKPNTSSISRRAFLRGAGATLALPWLPSFAWAQGGKAAENAKKHGVSFEEAKSVFVDERARLIDDPDHSEDENRFILLGLSSAPRLLLVCHCYRSEDGIIRIISARKATAKESRFYP